MGHRDIKQITETYGHLIKEKAEIENNKVRSVLTSLVKKRMVDQKLTKSKRNADLSTFLNSILYRRPGSNRHVLADTGF